MNFYNNQITAENICDYLKENIKSEKFEIYQDKYDSVVVHKKGRGCRTQVATTIKDNKLIVTDIDKNKGYVSSNLTLSEFEGAEVYKNSEVVGILKNKNDKPFVFLMENNIEKHENLWVNFNISRKGDLLYGQNIWLINFLETVCFATNFFNKIEKDIYFTLSFNEISAKYTEKLISPEKVIYIYPVNEEDNLKIGTGFGVVYKQGSMVSARKYRSESNIKAKPYFGTKEDSVGLYFASNCFDFIALCVPIHDYESACEILNTTDAKALIYYVVELLE